MGRNSGGVIGNGNNNDVHNYVSAYINKRLKVTQNLAEKDTSMLKKMVKAAKSYEPSDVVKIIDGFNNIAKRKGVKDISFSHNIFSGANSELYSFAFRAWCNKNLKAIQREINKRKS